MWRALSLAVLSACGAAAPASRPVVSSTDLDRVEAAPVPAMTDDASAGGPSGDAPLVFGLLDGEMALEEGWDRWRAGRATSYDTAFEIAVLANRARPLDMADELMVIALVRAVELSECDPERLGRIRLLAIAVHTSEHPRELDRELARLADIGPDECADATRTR